MANFIYVGKRTKENGKIDVKLPKCSHGQGPLEFLDVTPSVTTVSVDDPCHTAMLQNMKDVSKHPPEPSFKEI